MYYKQQSGKKFAASLTNLLGPTTLIRSLGALERTLSVLRRSPTNHSEMFSVNSKISNAGDHTS